jgi:hypothetical protein
MIIYIENALDYILFPFLIDPARLDMLEGEPIESLRNFVYEYLYIPVAVIGILHSHGLMTGPSGCLVRNIPGIKQPSPSSESM